MGSIPASIGSRPGGQAIWTMGHATGVWVGSQVGNAGTQWAVQAFPPQLPLESQVQVGSPAGQAHPVAAPPPAAQPQATQATSQRWPLGPSASEAQVLSWGLHVQGPPQGSAPAQTVSSPGLHVGWVQPQVGAGTGPEGLVAVPQGHW